jgi:thiamine phosphate synthase YjbQ (UPF0047 family)
MALHYDFKVKTISRQSFVDITHNVNEFIPKDFDGLCNFFIPHTTAGVTINDNAALM